MGIDLKDAGSSGPNKRMNTLTQKVGIRPAVMIDTSPGETQYLRDENWDRKYKEAKETIKEMAKDGQKIARDDYGYAKAYMGETGKNLPEGTR
tara:strand:- start:227 stop:505 length:279 start_codon:yes stop_codon:yes gene_type:complete